MSDHPRVAAQASPVAREPLEAIDLALSGGGFRATLFHLGVIACLRDTRFPGNTTPLLEGVKTICSVSGGSIMAAHLVCHWDDYSSESDDTFRERVTQLASAIMSTDVSGNVLAKSDDRLIQFQPLDTELLADEYVGLLDLENKRHRWDETVAGRPALYILATHLNTGRAGAFHNKGFDILPVTAEHRHANEIEAFAKFAAAANIKHLSITRAVAASSAFPPGFSPISLEPRNSTHLLTDGGVYDNSGVNYLLHLYKTEIKDTPRRLVIVSDAGRDFPTELQGQYDTFFTLALRVTDAQGGRIAEDDSAKARTRLNDEVKVWDKLFLSIHDAVPPAPQVQDNHSEKVQELLRTIRTEIDRFSPEEVFALYRHGYRVARQALLQHGFAPPSADAAWTPVDAENVRTLSKPDLETRLSNSHAFRKQLKGKLLRLAAKKIWRDYNRYVVAAVACVIALLAAVAYGGYWFGSPKRVEAVAPTGSLPIVEVAADTGSGWPATIPSLFELTTQGTRYTFATAPIGTLTQNRPHAGAVLRLDSQAALHGGPVRLFLDRGSSDARFVLLQQEGTGLKLPAGGPNDRLVGIVVSALPDARTLIRENVRITIEVP